MRVGRRREGYKVRGKIKGRRGLMAYLGEGALPVV